MTFKGDLYPFQQDAVEAMIERGSLMLVHEMGLGKTVSSIAAVERLVDEGEAQSILVLCPASVKWQWARQIKKFTDGALILVVEGNKADRQQAYRAVKRGDVEYVIMNYEQVVSDHETLRHLRFDVIVADEVVAIKNPGAKRTRNVRRLRAPYKFGLTGQPIENKPEELYSIMQWIDPTVLGPAHIFDKTFIKRNSFGGVKHYRNLHMLHDLMADAMDRKKRSDPDVAAQMPQVVEKDYIIEFDDKTKRLYNHIVEELIGVIRGQAAYGSFNLMDHYSGTSSNNFNAEVMPRLTALRMLCDHPRLLTISANNFDDPDSQAGSKYAAAIRGRLEGITTSAKMTATLDVITEILDENPRNKIVLFSFFKPMLAMLSDKLKVDHELFTGDLSAKERDDAKERFTNDPRCRVLLSSDAGGIGVDLPVANYLISYDLPWSAGKYAQRQGRIIRISSEWPEVTLLSMIMSDSIEEWMLDVLEQKMAVANAWVDGTGVAQDGTLQLTASGLCDFLETH